MEQLTGENNHHVFRSNHSYLSKRTKLIGIILLISLFSLVFYFIGYSVKAKQFYHIDSPEYIPIKWEHIINRNTECPSSYRGIPPLILVSFDGFRHDYLHRGLTPTLTNISQYGISTPFMYPVFPSKTFPNHFTIVTGLFPESHGIVGNKMIDPVTKAKFTWKNPSEFVKPHWWQGEPIWVTGQKQGKRSASFFWVGSEAVIEGMQPADYVKYNDKIPLDERVDKVLEWLDRPKETRPDFITLYASEPDSTGHRYGPCSSEVNQMLVTVDKTVNRLIGGIQQRGLLNCVNVIVLSDHGMTELSCDKLIKLTDYTSDLPEGSNFGAYGQIRPEGSVDAYIDSVSCKNAHMHAYKKGNLPLRFHYVNNIRIEPIFLNLDLGWTVEGNQHIYCSGGNHGYDNYYKDMKPFIVAMGPSFKVNLTVDPFSNIELYEMMCDLLNITASANNGTRGSLHHLLENPDELQPQPKRQTAPIANLPSKEEEKERILAANCSCSQDNVQTNLTVNHEIMNDKLFPFGIPYSEDNTNTNLLYNEEYVSAYSFDYRMPLWSTFLMPKVIFNYHPYKMCWAGDARIPKEFTSHCSDYNELDSEISQKPLFPLSFTANDHQYMEQASLITNSAPKHNNHIKLIEEPFLHMIASWYRLRGQLHIVMGPAFNVEHNGVKPSLRDIMNSTSNHNSFLLPTHYFYVITWCKVQVDSMRKCEPSQLDVASFLLPNFPLAYNCESSDELIKFNAARVADVEILTGISFFTSLPIYDAIRLRTQIPKL